MDNYNDVCGQLIAAGLLEPAPQVDGRMHRCRVQDGGRERKGWYVLHEWRADSGAVLCVGAFGVWQGNDPGTQKVDLRGAGTAMDNEERSRLRQLMTETRRRMAAQARAAGERAAERAAKLWALLAKEPPEGGNEYLRRKGVGAYGVRFSPKSGALVVPMCDAQGRVRGLQIIRQRPLPEGKREKEYFPAGVQKKGTMHIIGHVSRAEGAQILVAEGYATAASLHQATQMPVACAFDAGNIAPVVKALRERYRRARILLCADDDAGQKCLNPFGVRAGARAHDNARCGQRVWLPDGGTCPHCGEPHQAKNAGVDAAANAAQLACAGSAEGRGAFFAPRFADEAGRRAAWLERGVKTTDFNDLHAAEGIAAVRAQWEDACEAQGWNAPAGMGGGGGAGAGIAVGAPDAGGEGEGVRVVCDLDEMLQRFVWVAGETNVFDRATRAVMSDAAVRGLCVRRNLYRDWMESEERAVVLPHEIGFDPTERNAAIKCNTWGGWPTTPREGDCALLLELLRHLCGAGEAGCLSAEGERVYRWVLCWLALPLQRPGAKMKTALVVRGGQGTGKNLFFESVAKIYGRYAAVIDQSALERQFNSWASSKLFLIADEIVARSELWDVKNKLKALITGDTVYINPKGTAEREERNHANFVFLSNEIAPVPMELDDRRHMVIAQKTPREREFYAAVRAEIAAGGIAALHDWLLRLDLGDFHEGTPPLVTSAKEDAMATVQSSVYAFCEEFRAGALDGFPGVAEQGFICPLPSSVFYEVYAEWCSRNGIRNKMDSRRFVAILKNECDATVEKAHYYTRQNERKFASFVFLPGAQQMPPAASRANWLGEWAGYAVEGARRFRNKGEGNSWDG